VLRISIAPGEVEWEHRAVRRMQVDTIASLAASVAQSTVVSPASLLLNVNESKSTARKSQTRLYPIVELTRDESTDLSENQIQTNGCP
jgi:hypothetical protein